MTTTTTTDLVTSPATWGYERGLSLGYGEREASAFSRLIATTHLAGVNACARGLTRPTATARQCYSSPDNQQAFVAGYRHAVNRIREARAAGVAYVKRGGNAPGNEARRLYEGARPDELAPVLIAACVRGGLDYMAARDRDMHRKRKARQRAYDEGVAMGRICRPHADCPLHDRYTMGSDYDVRYQRGFAFGQAETRAELEAA